MGTQQSCEIRESKAITKVISRDDKNITTPSDGHKKSRSLSKEAFKREFPNKKYFDFWSPEVNKHVAICDNLAILVRRDKFTLDVDYVLHQDSPLHVDYVLYQYSPIHEHSFKIVYDLIYNPKKDIYNYIEFIQNIKIGDRFLLFQSTELDEFYQIGCYPSFTEASSIKVKLMLEISEHNNHYRGGIGIIADYLIVDLLAMMPHVNGKVPKITRINEDDAWFWHDSQR